MSEEYEDEFGAWLEETYRLRGITDLPGRYYKFLSSESKYFQLAMHELLLHSRVFLASRRDFNDPLDTNFGVTFPSDEEGISAFIQGVMSRAPESDRTRARVLISGSTEFEKRASANLSTSLDRIGIYSLSDSVAHPLMWAHYACSHRGIALIFRGAYGADILATFPIRYQLEYPRSTLGARGIQIHLSLVKGLAWDYEREWRLVEAGRARTWMEIPACRLEGIVFGACSSDETKEFILDLVARRATAGLPPLRVCKAKVGESFDLQFVQWHGDDGWQSIPLT